MFALVEFSPLLAFGVAYWLGGIYVATGVLMAAMVLTLLLGWWIKGKVSPVSAASTALVLVLGSATLVLRNVHFIQWKPSVFLWVMGVAFLVSAFVGKMPLAQRLLQGTLPELQAGRGQWQRVNAAFVLFCAVAGAANLLVAFHASEAAWIRFKVIGLPVAMVLFLFSILMWLQSRQTVDAT
jgi:intracellular septation protein